MTPYRSDHRALSCNVPDVVKTSRSFEICQTDRQAWSAEQSEMLLCWPDTQNCQSNCRNSLHWMSAVRVESVLLGLCAVALPMDGRAHSARRVDIVATVAFNENNLFYAQALDFCTGINRCQSLYISCWVIWYEKYGLTQVFKTLVWDVFRLEGYKERLNESLKVLCPKPVPSILPHGAKWQYLPSQLNTSSLEPLGFFLLLFIFP
jgi:hypothetical protein